MKAGVKCDGVRVREALSQDPTHRILLTASLPTPRLACPHSQGLLKGFCSACSEPLTFLACLKEAPVQQ